MKIKTIKSKKTMEDGFSENELDISMAQSYNTATPKSSRSSSLSSSTEHSQNDESELQADEADEEDEIEEVKNKKQMEDEKLLAVQNFLKSCNMNLKYKDITVEEKRITSTTLEKQQQEATYATITALNAPIAAISVNAYKYNNSNSTTLNNISGSNLCSDITILDRCNNNAKLDANLLLPHIKNHSIPYPKLSSYAHNNANELRNWRYKLKEAPVKFMHKDGTQSEQQPVTTNWDASEAVPSSIGATKIAALGLSTLAKATLRVGATQKYKMHQSFVTISNTKMTATTCSTKAMGYATATSASVASCAATGHNATPTTATCCTATSHVQKAGIAKDPSETHSRTKDSTEIKTKTDKRLTVNAVILTTTTTANTKTNGIFRKQRNKLAKDLIIASQKSNSALLQYRITPTTKTTTTTATTEVNTMPIHINQHQQQQQQQQHSNEEAKFKDFSIDSLLNK